MGYRSASLIECYHDDHNLHRQLGVARSVWPSFPDYQSEEAWAADLGGQIGSPGSARAQLKVITNVNEQDWIASI